MRAAAKSPVEMESRLRTGVILRSRRCEGPHLACPCSRARMRPPSPLRSRPDPGCHDIRHAAQGFGQEPTFGRRLLAKAPWGHSDCLETGTGARRERDRGGGSGTERGRGRCGSGAAVLGMARHEAGFSASKGLFANAPHSLHHNVLASAGGPHPTPTSKLGRREKTHLPRPRSVPPAHLKLTPKTVPVC